MNLSELAFGWRKLVLLLLVIFLIHGAYSFFTLPAREDPQITIRDAVVTTSFPGMSPDRVEALITKKLEQEIRRIPEVEEVSSSSITGRSIIHVTIQDRFTNLSQIWQNLRNKVAEAQSALPDGTAPSEVNDEFGDVAVITAALTGPDFPMSAKFDIAKHVRDVMYTVPGTKKVDLLGAWGERIYLEISNARLARLGIAPTQLMSILQEQNIIQPGGTVDTGAKSFIIEPTGNFDTFSQIGDTLIPIGDGDDAVTLSDIVDIRSGYVDPPGQKSFFNGEPAIIFAISMLPGNNVLEYAPRARAKLREIEGTLPIGVSLGIATYQADQVAQTVYGVSTSVVQTLLIVMVVVVLFLGFRTGMIVGSIVPFVMLTTLSFMNMFGLELERMSLATLIIALGLLVDNGIVIAEDFKRRLEEGASREVALRECGGELGVPLLISSLTTVLVFLPLMLAEHVAGEYTRSISLVILIALLVSWVLALTVTPTLCHAFLRIGPRGAGAEGDSAGGIARLQGPYRVFLRWSLRHRWLFMAVTVLLLVASTQIMGLVPKQFFPDSDRSQVLVYTELPAGTSSRTTERRMRDAFAFLDQPDRFPHVTSYLGHVGYGGPRFVLSLSPGDPAPNTGFIVLNVDSDANMAPTMVAVRETFAQHFPDMFVRVSRMFLGPSDSSKLEIQVKGHDADILYAKAKQIEAALRAEPGTTEIRNNWENRITKVLVRVDQKRARRAGVTSSDIATSMRAYFDGIPISDFRDDGDIVPILMRAAESERFNLDRMRSMSVYSAAQGVNVPLFQIADFEPYNEFARVERENLFRTVTVEAKSTVSTAEALKARIDPAIQALAADLPVNHSIEYDGVITDSAEAQAALSASVPMVLGLIIVLLVAQFRSYRRVLIIVLTIPLILIGAAIGLFATGSLFGFMVTLGLYSLAGIIINNAIVLIDKIDLERQSGKSITDAIVDACVLRLRPIIMTTITTILGLLPLILSRDPLFYGMSNAMAFGLGVGTILTLGVVPVLYAILFRADRPA